MHRRHPVRRSKGFDLLEPAKFQEARPFRLFGLTLVSGQSLRVARPEDLHVNFARQRPAVVESDGTSILGPADLARVKSLEP